MKYTGYRELLSIWFLEMPYCASTEIVKEGEDYLRMKAWFRMKIRIQNFRAFVEAKGHYFSEIVHFCSTRWQILLDLCKHDSVEKKVISSSRAKFLHAFVYAESIHKGNDLLLDINGDFKFERGGWSNDRKKSCTAKFTLNLNSTNNYQDDDGTTITNVDVTVVFYLFKN